MLIPYVRRSRKGEGEQVSIEKQKADIAAWAERNGVELAEPIEEKGVSGKAHWKERELGRAIAYCGEGYAEGIIVAYRSRLTREDEVEAAELRVALRPFRLVIVDRGRDKQPAEKTSLIDTLEDYQSHEVWETNAYWLKQGKHMTWESGNYLNRVTPAGYDGDLRKNEHADAVAHAFQVRATGGSWSEVARALRGVPTSKGETVWSTQGARSLAENPIYKGILRCTCGCGDSKFIKELAVVSESLWTKAQPATGPKSKGRKDHGKSLLAGLLVCRTCGKTMSHGSTGKYGFYRCRSGDRCPAHAAVSAPLAEGYLKEEALWAFATGGLDAGREPDAETLAQLEHDATRARERLEGLVRLIDPLDPGAGDRLAEARAEVANAEAAVLAERETHVERLSEAEVRAVFERSPVEEQRQLLRSVLLPMPVTPGRGVTIENRIEVAYRYVSRAA